MKRCLLAIVLAGCGTRTELHEPPPIQECPDPLITDVDHFALAGPKLVLEHGKDLVRIDKAGLDLDVLVPNVGKGLRSSRHVLALAFDAGEVFFQVERDLSKTSIDGGPVSTLASRPCGWECGAFGLIGVSGTTIGVLGGDSFGALFLERLDRAGRHEAWFSMALGDDRIGSRFVAGGDIFVSSNRRVLRWDADGSSHTIADAALLAHDARFLYLARPRGKGGLTVERMPLAGGAADTFVTFEDETTDTPNAEAMAANDGQLVVSMKSPRKDLVRILLLEEDKRPRTLARCATKLNEFAPIDGLETDGTSAFFIADMSLRRASF